MRTALVLLTVVFALTACQEVHTCPQGMAFPPGRTECVVVGDGGPDGGQRFDAGDGGVDAGPGPCGVCPSETPHCDREQMECFACLGDHHCGGSTPRCAAGRCAACAVDLHCPAAQPACVAGTCRSCIMAAEDTDPCADRPGLPVCNATNGACVQCTGVDESACEGNPCRTNNTCSAFGERSQRTCESCDADRNCAEGYYCVPMQFEGMTRASGYCLQLRDVSCSERPFTIPTPMRTSLSSASGIFCGINEMLTTCEAVRALIDAETCVDDGGCPRGGFCRLTRCTYECEGVIQCPNIAPDNTCGRGLTTGPMYCGG